VTRGADDSLGALARTVIGGEATLRDAAANSWHSQGLATCLEAALQERQRMSPEQLAEFERAAQRLRSSPDANDEGEQGCR
jgi:hypothetical protein